MKVIKRAIESCDSKKIINDLDFVKKIKVNIINLQNELNAQYKYSLKKLITAISSIVFMLFILIAIFGYSGAIMCFNRLASDNHFPTLLTCKDETGIYNSLLLSLPPDATYSDCLFQSFSIMTTSQDFTISNTSIMGKLIIIIEILTILFLFTILLSIFSTIISLEDEIDILSTKDITDAMLDVLDEWCNKLEISSRKLLNP